MRITKSVPNHSTRHPEDPPWIVEITPESVVAGSEEHSRWVTGLRDYTHFHDEEVAIVSCDGDYQIGQVYLGLAHYMGSGVGYAIKFNGEKRTVQWQYEDSKHYTGGGRAGYEWPASPEGYVILPLTDELRAIAGEQARKREQAQ